MNNQDPEQGAIDAWTGMPVDFEETDLEAIAQAEAVYAIPRKPLGFGAGVGALLWKHVASGSASTSAAILAVLSTDERAYFRRRCASNPNTGGDTLALLAGDEDEGVRTAVARNKHTPLYILRKLSQDASPQVRFAIAANNEMPDAILLSLFLDPDPFVAERASQTLAA